MEWVELWLREHYPTRVPVRVSYPRKIESDDPRDSGHTKRYGLYGECYEEDDHLVIQVALQRHPTQWMLIETLIHEWAHHLVPRSQRHGRVWRETFETIRDHYHYGGGAREVRALRRQARGGNCG